MKTKLFLRPDGTIEGLYSDTIPLRKLGKLNVSRATYVEFDCSDQKWVVTLPDGTELYRHQSRDTALELERNYCDSLLTEGYRPDCRGKK
jgi:hypothetical protein